MLCGVFGKDASVQPLTQSEYTSLVRCLVQFKMRPSDLLENERLSEVSQHSGIDRDRLAALLARGMQLGIATEEWHRNGVWVISRSDTDYPDRLKKHLKDKAPPFLYCIGSRSLLSGEE